MKLPDIKLILTCHCERASLLASEALDRELSFSERCAMHIHHAICSQCRRAARQLRELQQAVSNLPEEIRRTLVAPKEQLSAEAKARIIDSMRGSDR